MCDLTDFLRNVTSGRQGDCTNPYIPTVGWGFDAVVCRKHYDMAVMLFESSAPALSQILDPNGSGAIRVGSVHVPLHAYNAQYLADYVKLLVLMQNRKAVMECMQKLNAELSKTVARQKKTPHDLDDRFHTVKKQARGYVRISRALSYYEQRCLFPSSHVVFSGALTAANFYWSLTQGFMPKDPGAGVAHGDFSHRLQWHAVMRVVTNDFAVPHFGAWSKTPLDLFTSLGAGAAMNRNLWGVIFDGQGRPHYTDPANLFADVRRNADLGVLQVQIDRSFTKRGTVERECQRMLDEVLARPALAQVKDYLSRRPVTQKPDRPIAANVANCAYHWKKLGGPTNDPLFDPAVHPAVPAYTVVNGFAPLVPASAAYVAWDTYLTKLTEYIAREFWNRYINDYRAEVGSFLRGSRHTSYVNESNGMAAVDGVIVANDRDRLVGLNVANRVTASYAGFSLLVTYSPGFGCQPATI
jgi:hypothetical protein